MRIYNLLRTVVLGAVVTCIGIFLLSPAAAWARQPSQTELARISQEIAGLAGVKDALGLDGVSLDDLEAADVIPIASFTKSGQVSQYMSFYPLKYEGRYVAGFLEGSDGELFYQTGLANLLQTYCDENNPEQVGFIYNAKGLCITDGTRTKLVSSYMANLESHDQLSLKMPLKKQLKSFDVADTDNTLPLSLAASTKNVPATVITMDDVTLVSQPNNSNICWAATLSMMYGCHGHKYYSAVEMARYYLGSNYNQPRPWSWIASTLRNMGLGNYRYHTGWLSYNTILGYIQKGYPIVGAMKYYRDATHFANSTEHALVVMGCISDNRIIVNNPWPTGGRTICKSYWNPYYGVYVYYYIDPESTPGNIAYAVLSGCIKYDV